ncbi:serine/threonine protein kinase domain protein [Thioalkalivibrio sulfidiphilus HL-EbGr7]|uniref:Serine/threonine protein kinase domain protein n=1 Tax=Thioalkalivibrio sulfidiphilus (strain HL-EbGR7) TaxID=396588 RepID=B8GPW6_THISH|nr:protein kinase [Thioalkalivibrio sulfidiphilus]ACL74113.1 serine/threonine protein kinase domain protein [Thioalkalivibrio sulfidiphilus HL-EbGr7]
MDIQGRFMGGSVRSFNLEPGQRLLDKYLVMDRLGAGWEGEVYRVRELATGIERTAKFFFPQRNPRDRAAIFYARKLHKLRQCPIVIQYYTRERMVLDGVTVSFLVSEFVEGELLSAFIRRHKGGRLSPFPALHLLHALARGIECIHQMGDYHGDLHSDNVIVSRYGLGFELRLLDLFHWGRPRAENIHDDVVNLIHIFHEALGGKAHYARLPPEIKAICCGLKRSLILKKFRTAGQLREYLETMEWGR